jgi:FkbM family methyltransferase
MSKFQTAYSIWRNEGTLSLIKKSTDWAYRQPLYWYYRQIGFQNFAINNVDARFDISDRDAIHRIRWMYRGNKEEVALVLEELREDDVFFDIGANIGLFTSFASRKIREGSVQAFEPYPPNVGVLNKNAKLNADNVNIHNIALSNNQSTDRFQQPNESVGSQVGALAPQDDATTYEVETASVDGLISADKVPIPNVVKIDVEGAESLVLEGMEKTLERDACRALFCEIHPPNNPSRPSIEDFDSSLGELLDLCSSKGFDVRVAREKNPILIAKKE